jgi:hypothetical protein
LKKGNAKNFWFFERYAFRMDKVKERQFLVEVRGKAAEIKTTQQPKEPYNSTDERDSFAL